MKKTRKPLCERKNGAQLLYILNAINGEAYGKEFDSDADRINFFFDCFESEYGFFVSRYGLQGAISEYLQGLPSCISLPFYYSEIGQLLESWGVAPTERNLSNFWNVCALRLLQLREILND